MAKRLIEGSPLLKKESYILLFTLNENFLNPNEYSEVKFGMSILKNKLSASSVTEL